MKKHQGAPWKKYYLWKSENWKFWNVRNFGNTTCPFLEFLKFRMPDFLIIRNDEFLKIMKSRRRGISWHSFCRRNFLKSLDLNLVSIKKWNENVVNRTNLFIFGQGNPYHQSTYRLTPLHPISAPNVGKCREPIRNVGKARSGHKIEN